MERCRPVESTDNLDSVIFMLWIRMILSDYFLKNRPKNSQINLILIAKEDNRIRNILIQIKSLENWAQGIKTVSVHPHLQYAGQK